MMYFYHFLVGAGVGIVLLVIGGFLMLVWVNEGLLVASVFVVVPVTGGLIAVYVLRNEEGD